MYIAVDVLRTDISDADSLRDGCFNRTVKAREVTGSHLRSECNRAIERIRGSSQLDAPAMVVELQPIATDAYGRAERVLLIDVSTAECKGDTAAMVFKYQLLMEFSEVIVAGNNPFDNHLFVNSCYLAPSHRFEMADGVQSGGMCVLEGECTRVVAGTCDQSPCEEEQTFITVDNLLHRAF